MNKRKIAAVLGVVAMLALAYYLGLFQQFESPTRAKETLTALGAWGYVAFIVAYALLQPFGVPGTVFVFVAPLIWPWPTAFALSMTGTMAASVIGFSFARFIARDFVSSRIPQRFRKYEDALERRGFVTVATLRFIFWMPQVLHAFLGVSKVRFSTHFWGSLVGYAPILLAVSYFGEKFMDAMKDAPPKVWIGLALGVALVAATTFVVRRSKRAPRSSNV
jgi:uncharacterized membrane protein YdjX (TVP38/TMEM64 family)